MPQTIACDRILGDQLTESDIVLYCSSRILVITEPQYTYSGIVFDAVWIDIDSPDNIQQLCLDPALKLDLVSTAPVSDTRAA